MYLWMDITLLGIHPWNGVTLLSSTLFPVCLLMPNNGSTLLGVDHHGAGHAPWTEQIRATKVTID